MSRILAPLAAAPLLLGALSACTSGSGISMGEAATTPVTSAATTAVAAADTSTTTSATSSTPTTSTSTTSAAADTIDDVQLRLSSSDEVSPGVLQSSNGVSAGIEWMAVSGAAAYDGEKCAAVVTLTDPGGQIVETDRQSTCTGSTNYTIWPNRTGTGEYTVTASLAPWEDSENPVESTLEFTIIAYGT